MDLQLLGPVEATVQGRPIPLGATKQRALLAMLALRANSTVSVELLVDGLWGEDPPATAPKMVQLYVSQLRRLFAGNGAEIVTHGRGYELRLDAEHVDAVRFERLVEQEQPREALALWRGDALANISGEPFAAAEIRRLEELRLHATELAIDAGLAAGRHGELIGELDKLVADHPLSERLHAQRMLALYRSGRQSEALEAYRHARSVLVEEIGVEPGPELRALHDAVLRQDPTLDLAEPAAPAAAAPPPEPSPTAGPRRGVRLLVIAGALALLAGAAVFGVTRLTADDSLPRIDENHVGLIDADGRITAEYGLGRGASALADGGGSVWAANGPSGTVSRISRDDGSVVAIPVGGEPAGLAFGAGSLWVADRRDRSVLQISPAVDRVVRTYTVGNAPRAVAAAFGSIWVASEVDPAITRIDLAKGRVTGKVDLAANPTALAVSRDALWAASEEAGTVYRIDPRSGTVVKPIRVGNAPVGLAVGAGGIWVLNRQDATVSRIDPANDTVTGLVRVGRDPSAIAAGESGVWVASGGEGSVWRIDPDSGRVADKVPIGSSPNALVVAGDRLWTAALPSPASHRGGTLRVESFMTNCQCFEPGSYEVHDWMNLSYDGLLTYRRTGGSTFGQLVGDLATGVPEPSADGRTYVFRLRPNLRYSDGSPVRPEDFRAALEDLLRRWGTSFATYFSHIRGAPACVSTPKRCDLSEGIETDPATRTITIHLTAPDPDLVHVLALPVAWLVPANHPFHKTDIPPGTGPYEITEFDPRHGAHLVRNPHFKLWSQDARPDGYADRIDVHLGSGLRPGVLRAVRAVQRGQADATLVVGVFGGPLTIADVRALEAESAGQLSTDAAAELDYMYLNVTTPPFDDQRVRQAINYATDRKRMVELARGDDLAQPACDIVPVSFPGYEPACRYTRNPGPAGAWTGPDMATARRLIAESGTKGMKVTVWGYAQKAGVIRYFAALLRRLGYRTSIRMYPDYYTYSAQYSKPSSHPQIGINGWSADFAAPSTMASPFVCVPNDSHFCDRGLRAQIDQAIETRGDEAKVRWRNVFRRLSEAAPIVPLINRRRLSLVSKRVGNQQYHPWWGALYDQMWVR